MSRQLAPGSAEAVKELLERIPVMPVDQRIDFLEMLVTAGVHFMRAGSGVEYVRGFLQSAIESLEAPPLLVIHDRAKN